MEIETRAAVTVAAPIERAFALATDLANFHKYFKGSGPIPAVLKVEWRPGARPVPGAQRDVHNADGSVIVEELLELTAPERHRYRLLSGFKPPFSFLVAWAEGDWHFAREGAGTRIAWDYRFKLRSPLALPVVAPIVQIFFRRAMQDCLDAMRGELEGRRR
jgi:hypothetical protein